MKFRFAISIVLGLGLVLVGYLAGSRSQGPVDRAGEAEMAAVEVWTCSMHPQVRLPEPGQCPICFMDLIPLTDSSADEDSEARLSMSPAALRLAEIRTTPVTRGFPTMELRMVGKVEVDETRVRTLAAWTSGRLDRLYVDYTGVSIRKGDHLVWMYSPALVTAQEELLQALRAESELGSSQVEILRETASGTVQAAREKLRLLGLTPQQVRAIEESGEVDDHVTIYSPIDGVVLQKLADEGSYVSTGTPIYRIADLGHVWVKIDAYESDLTWLRFGQRVSFTTEAWPGREFTGRISFIDPVLDERTRTAKVRVNLDNADRLLKPGMFVRAVAHPQIAADGHVMASDLAGKWISPMHPEVVKDGPGQCDVCGMDLVRIESLGYEIPDPDAQPPLLVPASAPLVTGKRAVVYVQVPGTERPTFEGREVVLGPRADEVYVVREGLAEGERVVVNGAFKIDSAMQIQARPSMMMPADEAAAAHQHGGAGPVERFEAPAEFRSALGGFVRVGLELTSALAADDAAGSSEVAGRLAGSLAAIPMGGLEAGAHERWMEIHDDLSGAVTAMQQAGDLSERRRALATLTTATAEALRNFGAEIDLDVRRFHCPMAFDNAGADWLQSGAEVANPYFGARMLRCGSQEEMLVGAER